MKSDRYLCLITNVAETDHLKWIMVSAAVWCSPASHLVERAKTNQVVGRVELFQSAWDGQNERHLQMHVKKHWDWPASLKDDRYRWWRHDGGILAEVIIL